MSVICSQKIVMVRICSKFSILMKNTTVELGSGDKTTSQLHFEFRYKTILLGISGSADETIFQIFK